MLGSGNVSIIIPSFTGNLMFLIQKENDSYKYKLGGFAIIINPFH